MQIKNVSLEMSLKPFKRTDDAYLERVCRKLFEQWYALTKHADQVSVLLWTADGSEILEYKGDLDEEMEWARYVGGATRRMDLNPHDPDRIGLHSRPYLYMDNPPVITYGLLRRIVGMLKRIGGERNHKPIRVGATFDPGPEFAKSPFKYERHNEICGGDTMGARSFVCAHATLNADDHPYAGFPTGIPQDTPFGIFFGRQCQHFLSDLGFDYIWFSNGFGFGTEPWGVRGAIFDGEDFHTGTVTQIEEDLLSFWRFFRQECPHFPIETRGTNLSTGIDLSTDGVPLKAIYKGGFGILPPPNSPWAAINGDFGIELIGHMSRICELPGRDYPFRFYVHDPWWMNSPWLDRYGREPHDIYLPLALTRLDETGTPQPPTHIQFLTVDNSLGGIPDQAPNEVIPHLLAALAQSPDAVSPVVWIYPFDEVHEMVHSPERVREVFFGDWFMRGAVANGFPINTVVSTANFLSSLATQPNLYRGSVLVTPTPDAGSELEQRLMEMVRSGGQLLLYGPLGNASPDLLSMLNLGVDEPIAGDLRLDLKCKVDRMKRKAYPPRTMHRPLLSAGGVEAILAGGNAKGVDVCATVSDGEVERIAALYCQRPGWNSGRLGWVRGTVSSELRPGQRLLVADDPAEFFPGEALMRFVLARFGYEIGVEKADPGVRAPLTLVSRHANAFFFSGFTPNTTARLHLRFPQGAPLLLGYETELVDGRSTYSMPRAWNRECRVFVEQAEDSILSYVELPAVSYRGKRKMAVSGLQNATVRFYPEHGLAEKTKILLNAHEPYVVGEPLSYALKQDQHGLYFEAYNVTGRLIFTWDLPDLSAEEIDPLTAIYK